MEITQEGFKKILSIQVRFSDIDALGHINNNIYCSYYDLGKTDYFEALKKDSVSWTEGLIVLARVENDFFLPVFYKDNIVVETKIVHLGNKSGTFLQQIRKVNTDEIMSRSKSIFVAFDAKTGQSMAIPPEWRKAISDFEKT